MGNLKREQLLRKTKVASGVMELGTIACTGDEASSLISATLERAGLRVYRSFDLRSVRAVDNSCACSYHGTEACDCQMVVLLVYEGQGAPATLVLHGHEGRTWMSLVEAPHAGFQASIIDALEPVHSCAGEPSQKGQSRREQLAWEGSG